MSGCVPNLSLQGVFYGIRSFLSDPDYCSAINITQGISGKTFIVQVHVNYSDIETSTKLEKVFSQSISLREHPAL